MKNYKNDTIFRVEKKYEISQVKRHLILNWLLENASKDLYAKELEGYSCVSHYFDTLNFLFYNEHVEGEYVHKKVRYRSYGEGNHFLEFKTKVNELTYKFRKKISNDTFQSKELSLNELDENLAGYFHCPYISNFYQVCSIRYKRIPFYLRVDNIMFRINIDYKLESRASSGLPWLPFYSGDGAILEVKGAADSFSKIRFFLDMFCLTETSFSKYCRAISYLNLH